MHRNKEIDYRKPFRWSQEADPAASYRTACWTAPSAGEAATGGRHVTLQIQTLILLQPKNQTN